MVRVRQSTVATVAVFVLVVGFFALMSFIFPPASTSPVAALPEDDGGVWCTDAANKSLGMDLRFVEWHWRGKTAGAFFPAGPEVVVEVVEDSMNFRRGSRALGAVFDMSHQTVVDPSKKTGNMLGWFQESRDYLYVTWLPDIRDLPSLSAECVADMFPDDPAMARVRALAKN
ncbi:MAG: hypothetical protein HY455_03275 [Parcubacteria group bacterium]|nr:hypothetical protein [Parcubacteria group bacterium]